MSENCSRLFINVLRDNRYSYSEINELDIDLFCRQINFLWRTLTDITTFSLLLRVNISAPKYFYRRGGGYPLNECLFNQYIIPLIPQRLISQQVINQILIYLFQQYTELSRRQPNCKCCVSSKQTRHDIYGCDHYWLVGPFQVSLIILSIYINNIKLFQE